MTVPDAQRNLELQWGPVCEDGESGQGPCQEAVHGTLQWGPVCEDGERPLASSLWHKAVCGCRNERWRIERVVEASRPYTGRCNSLLVKDRERLPLIGHHVIAR